MSSEFSLVLLDVLCIWLIAVVIITQKVSLDKLFGGLFVYVGKIYQLWVGRWREKAGIGKLLQREEPEKQADWVEKSKMGKFLQ